MNVKADAFLDYDQAVVIDKLISGLPEIVRAFAAPRLCFNVRQTDRSRLYSKGAVWHCWSEWQR